jgi:YVTN family beta-propeller protein
MIHSNFGRCRVFIGALFLAISIYGSAQTYNELKSSQVQLPNGWKLTPVGKSLSLGDLPLNIAVCPSKKLLAVTNNGQSIQTIQLIDAANYRILDSVEIKKSWLGLVFSADGKSLYASGGNDNLIIRYAIENNRLVPSDTFVLGKPWPVKISVAGICLDDVTQRLYVVTKENNSFYVLDIKSKTVLKQIPLGGEGYTCILSPDKKSVYVSCWGCDKVQLFNTEQMEFTGSVPVGDNPNDLCLTKNGRYLFVANANDNSVSVVDTRQHKVIETLNTALFADAPAGSTANSVALSDDNKTLFIANADNNCLAVFDVSKPGFSKSKGFVPTGWYPTCVRVFGKSIYVANGKGFTSMANPLGPNPARKNEEIKFQKGQNNPKAKLQYIGGLFKGKLCTFSFPDEKQMAVYSKLVFENTPYSKEKESVTEGMAGNPVPFKKGDISPIKHVFYIIKENRTYDQILGDIPQGNGDTSLVLFGERITPNQHALTREFVLLDNFYVDGEVSADGHNWSLGAYATDYLEKTWPTSYGDRGGNYDAEGNREIANNKNGFIWNLCKQNGVSYRTYGEFADDYKPNIPVLKDHFCKFYTSWDQRVRDTVRFSQWKRDFDSLLLVNNVPQLNTLRLINDHTEGLKKDRPTPFVHVADNDLSVGLFVEYLSHSSIWNQSVVFIVEDDAQDGPDHVDAHRSPVYLAGGFVKQGFVDHTPYTTSSVLRTIELILGLPPMSQYDAAATPMWRCFSETAGHRPFTSIPCNIDLTQTNQVVSKWSEKSEKFDFSKEDKVKEAEFNEVIWAAVKGGNSKCPAPTHAAFFKEQKADND